MPLDSLVKEDDPRCKDLQRRLENFYRTTESYQAFQEPSDHSNLWQAVLVEIEQQLAKNKRCRILEFGAGKSGFAKFLPSTIRNQVELHSQDITPSNKAFLEEHTEVVHIGELQSISGDYDIIFSTFVWEHIWNPKESLTHLCQLLAPSGAMFIASPKYDFPFYLSPSAKHLPLLSKALLLALLTVKKMIARITGAPLFLIHLEPAVLSTDWFRDADAIHWVSQQDIPRALGEGYLVRSVDFPTDNWRYAFYKRFLLMFVKISRTH